MVIKPTTKPFPGGKGVGNQIKCFWGGHCILAGNDGTSAPAKVVEVVSYEGKKSLLFPATPEKPAACLVLAPSQQCRQLSLRESHGCPCFNSIANYTHKFRVQLIVVLWSRCSLGKKKVICKHSDALLSRVLFILGEE